MMKFRLLIVLVLLAGCTRKSTLSEVPKITFNSLNPQVVRAGSSTDATVISFTIEDGDGDIGFGTRNLYLTDSRDENQVAMIIPTIPKEYSPQKGLKGNVEIIYLAAWLSLRPDTNHLTRDTLQWKIFMKDEAGHTSNTIYTDSLYLFK